MIDSYTSAAKANKLWYNQLSNCDIIVKMLSKYIILIALLRLVSSQKCVTNFRAYLSQRISYRIYYHMRMGARKIFMQKPEIY